LKNVRIIYVETIFEKMNKKIDISTNLI